MFLRRVKKAEKCVIHLSTLARMTLLVEISKDGEGQLEIESAPGSSNGESKEGFTFLSVLPH